jgi:hypothetical protein
MFYYLQLCTVCILLQSRFKWHYAQNDKLQETDVVKGNFLKISEFFWNVQLIKKRAGQLFIFMADLCFTPPHRITGASDGKSLLCWQIAEMYRSVQVGYKFGWYYYITQKRPISFFHWLEILSGNFKLVFFLFLDYFEQV